MTGEGSTPDRDQNTVLLRHSFRSWKWRWMVWLAIIPLLWFIFRQIDSIKLLAVLGNLSLVELSALTIVNSLVIFSLSSRWWLILHGKGERISYWELSLYRLAAFSLSYFTPGPQFGGEPLQIQALRARHRMPASRAGASVALDKSLELAVNFGFLIFGVVVALILGVLPGGSSALFLGAAIGLFVIPVIHLSLAARGRRPITALIMALPSSWLQSVFIQRVINLVKTTEHLVADYLKTQPRWVLSALAASVVSWLLLVGEYWLMAQFLELDLSLWMAITALTAARLAFLLPSPGGLGTLEASQVLAFSALSNSPTAGAALALLIRGRDLVFGGVGLLIVAWLGVDVIPAPDEAEGDRTHPIGGPGK